MLVLIVGLGDEGKGGFQLTPRASSNNSIKADEQPPLEPVTLAIGDEIVGQQHGDKHDGHLEHVEAQVHVLLAETPADDDEEGDEEEGDLHAGADGDADGEVHLVLDGDGHGGGVLGGVADDGEEDEADKLLRDAVAALGHGVDGADHELGAEGDDDGGEEQRAEGDEEVQLRLLLLVVVLAVQAPRVHEHLAQPVRLLLLRDAVAQQRAGHGEPLLDGAGADVAAAPGLGGHLLALLGEDGVVRLELEEEVCDVDDEQDDRGSAREGGDVADGGVAGLVEDGGHNDGRDGESEE